jgi:4-amino-4-deoxy-L-arabinose transferase-like glycosyltransferase
VFFAISYSAVLTKSATFDEPYNFVGGFMRQHRGDYRFDVADPALFGRLAALTTDGSALQIPDPARADAFRPRQLTAAHIAERDLYRDFPRQTGYEWILAVRALYQTPGVDAQGLIDRARLPFALLGAVLVLVLAAWAGRLAGASAAIAAAVLLALDPNFLAHAPLVKNDVPIALLMVATMWVTWRVGQRASAANVGALVLSIAVAFNLKYSGVLFAPLAGAALVVRAFVPADWPAFGRMLASRWRRLALVGALGATTAFATVGTTWACYGFRFAPHADPELRLDTAAEGQRVLSGLALLRGVEMEQQGYPRSRIDEAMREERAQPLAVRVATWIEGHRLLPQAWTNGFVYTYASSLMRASFLRGERRATGWYSYFPLAMSWKTPIATILALVLLPALALVLGWRRRLDWSRCWSMVCVGLPPVVYGANAIASNMNIGLRHVLPVYPFLFVAAALSFAYVIRVWRRGVWLGAGLAVGLAAESLAAYPDFLPFFNVAAGGARGGLHLLSDSNLDWGQDLEQLAAWRLQHRDQPLFVSYWGLADPRWYVPDANLLPGGLVGDSAPPVASIPAGAYLAISASCLQGLGLGGPVGAQVLDLVAKQTQLVAVLGGSIYVYRVRMSGSARDK